VLRAGLALLALSVLLAGCTAARVGDLGRADPVWPDNWKEVQLPGTPRFNKTDQEEEMADRIWRFIHAPHVAGWFNLAVPLPVSADAKPRQVEEARAAYYQWLQQTAYRSSRVRYSTVAADIQADIDTLPTTFDAICAVREVDRQRAVALAGLTDLEPGTAEKVAERRDENDTAIGDFTRALFLRYEAYGYALSNLLVETPHEEAIEVDGLLSELAGYVERADRGEFCAGGGGVYYADEVEGYPVVPGLVTK
jgi:hypothetical protein